MYVCANAVEEREGKEWKWRIERAWGKCDCLQCGTVPIEDIKSVPFKLIKKKKTYGTGAMAGKLILYQQ